MYNQKALDVLFKMAHSLADIDPLKQYLLQVITDLKIKLDKPLEIHKGVGALSYINILFKDTNLKSINFFTYNFILIKSLILFSNFIFIFMNIKIYEDYNTILL